MPEHLSFTTGSFGGSFAAVQEAAGGCKPLKGVILLAVAMACNTSIAAAITTISPLAAKKIGAGNAMATATIGSLVVGTSFSALLSGTIFARYGRLKGFGFSVLFFITGAVISMIAIIKRDPLWEVVGNFVIGMGGGIANFLRFAAVEITISSFKAKAVTYVLIGGIGAAIMGPLGSALSINMIPGHAFLGCYVVILCFIVVMSIILLNVDFPVKPNLVQGLAVSEPKSAVTINEVMRSPTFITAVAMSAFAQAIMVVLMSTVTLAMHFDYGYAELSSTRVILLHMLAMFLPGFFTGVLIAKFGVVKVSGTGMVIYAASLVILYISHSYAAFILAMILVGIGWNFGYTSGSVLLLGSYPAGDPIGPLVQSRHDFIVLFFAGAGSFGAGAVFQHAGWDLVLGLTVCLVVLQAVAIAFAWRIRRRFLEEQVQDVKRQMSIIDEDSADRSSSHDGAGLANRAQGEMPVVVDVYMPGVQDLRASIDGGSWVDEATLASMRRSMSGLGRGSFAGMEAAGGTDAAAGARAGEGDGQYGGAYFGRALLRHHQDLLAISGGSGEANPMQVPPTPPPTPLRPVTLGRTP
jgi:MFS family permease